LKKAGRLAVAARLRQNVAAALALAAVSGRAAGRVYNVAEVPAFTELKWAGKIAAATGWYGEFALLPKERMPAHLAPRAHPPLEFNPHKFDYAAEDAATMSRAQAS
jgi:hypothetical protein